MCTNTTKMTNWPYLFTLSGVQNKAKLVKPQSQKYIPPSRNKHWFYMQAKCTNQMQKKKYYFPIHKNTKGKENLAPCKCIL